MAEKNLVIVESPAKAKTIGKYLGRSYTVKASMGHLRDLPKSKLGIDIEHDFEPDYKPIRGKEALIRELKEAAKESDTVYLATDPDREGEAISWHLKYLLDLNDQKARRVTFNEITKNVVQESIARPREIDQNLVDAQQARRVLDRIVGYELSPLLWKKVRRGLSAGRVQSVATRMVDEREKEIESFKPEGYMTIAMIVELWLVIWFIYLVDNPRRSLKKRLGTLKRTTFLRRMNTLSLTAYILEPFLSKKVFALFQIPFGKAIDTTAKVCLWDWPIVALYALTDTLIAVGIARLWENCGFRFSIEYQLGAIMHWIMGRSYSKLDYKENIYGPIEEIEKELNEHRSAV